MGSYNLEVQMLHRMPVHYKSDLDRILPDVPEDLVQCCGPEPLNDAYHAVLKTTSRFCTMDDLKQYLRTTRKDLDLSGTWSMTGGYGYHPDVTISAGGKTIVIPAGEYEALKTDHVVTATYALQDTVWSMDGLYSDKDWLKPLLPCYLSAPVLRKFLSARIDYAMLHSDPDDDFTRRDVLGFLADALAYAKARGLAAWAYFTD